MAELSFVVHLPLLRMTPETFDCGGFQLWRLPFDVFDDLSQGAFRDHRAQYDATAPVFLRADMSIPAGDGLVERMRVVDRGSAERKVPTSRWDLLEDMGLGVFLALHTFVVERFLSALALAAPASLLPPPRWSVTFAQVDEEHAFVVGAERAGTVRVQGDADLEYLFAPACAGSAVDADTLRQAVEWQGLVDFTRDHEDLAAALQALRAAAAPTLTDVEQSLICSVALEALLLPEVQSGLQQTFATRSSHLPAAQDPKAVRAAAVTLYDARSAGVHGAAQTPDASAAVRAAYAPQLLAAAVVALAYGLHEGRSLDDLRSALDREPLSIDGVPPWTLQDQPAGLRAPHRISPPVARHPYISRFSSDGLQGRDDQYVGYAPLTDLSCADVEPLAEPTHVVLMPLTGTEVVSLEDKDIARDYLAQLHRVPERIAALYFALDAEGLDERDALRGLRRMRDLAVASLRLAGFDQFIDPELAGLHVLYKRRPLREPSVLRQTVLTRLKNEPSYAFCEADRPRRTLAWALLFRYQGSPRHPDIEGWLSAFRKLHDGEFLPPLARANLGIALVEGLLGRFRAPGEPQSLETLVSRVASGSNDPAAMEAAAWFATEARSWRNALAHGRLRQIDEGPIAHLRAIARAAIPRAVALWLDGGDPKRRPAKLLISELTAPSFGTGG